MVQSLLYDQFDKMLDNEKWHWIGFTGEVILKWFQNQVEWKIHPTQLDLSKMGKNCWTCINQGYLCLQGDYSSWLKQPWAYKLILQRSEILNPC
jgi:hypothetical protein